MRALAKMPADYPYRKNTESLINDRISTLKQSNTIEEAEKLELGVFKVKNQRAGSQ